MKGYFTDDGHLTSLAFQDLAFGEPDELSRLEIAEHLSFCDECTARYADFLSDGILEDLPEPLSPSVLKKLRQRTRVVFFNRYVRVGIAACLTLLLWLGGIFSLQPMKPQDKGSPVSFSESFSQKTAEFTQNLTDSVNQFFNRIDLKGVFHYEKEK